MRTVRSGFTLIELLVVIAIVALLIGIILPVMAQVRSASKQVACLSNARQLQTAFIAYMADHQGRLLQTSHGTSWIITLQRDYSPDLLLRSPVDESPHFAGGQPIGGRFRQTSYAINRYLAPDFTIGAQRVTEVPSPGVNVHTGIKVYFQRSGDTSDTTPLSDHLHADQWVPDAFEAAAVKASKEMQINAHGGELRETDAISTYGYLDGHAAVEPFRRVYVDAVHNRFDYRVAH